MTGATPNVTIGQTLDITDPESSTDPAAPGPPPPPNPPFPLPWPPLMASGVALRPWGADASDARTLAAAWADHEVARWTAVPAAHGEADAARWVDGEALRRDRGVAVDLVITPAGEPHEVHGEVGLVLVEPEQRWAEVGYWLFPHARRMGRAAVALELFSGWALHDLGITRLIARTDGANPASARVAERAGYHHAGELPDGIHVWVRDAPPTPSEPDGS